MADRTMTKPGHKSFIRTAAVAALLACLMGGPAMAQPYSAFGLQFWNDTYEPRKPELGICMTDRQIRQAIAARGYSDISLNVAGDRRIQVRATEGRTVYLLDFDFCNNTIIDRQALR
jgi:hypothetical protein